MRVLLSATLVSTAVAVAFPQVKGGGGGGSIVSPYQKDNSGGSGPYKAAYKADPSLPKHTIYYPKSPPDIEMPVIVWGEGKHYLLLIIVIRSQMPFRSLCKPGHGFRESIDRVCQSRIPRPCKWTTWYTRQSLWKRFYNCSHVDGVHGLVEQG
jgi:hypothetical protein